MKKVGGHRHPRRLVFGKTGRRFGAIHRFPRLLVDLGQVACDLERGRVVFQGFDLTGLDAVIVKKLGPSDSPRLPDRLEILKYLERRGVRVFSRPDSLARVLSRLACTLGLKRGRHPHARPR